MHIEPPLNPHTVRCPRRHLQVTRVSLTLLPSVAPSRTQSLSLRTKATGQLPLASSEGLFGARDIICAHARRLRVDVRDWEVPLTALRVASGSAHDDSWLVVHRRRVPTRLAYDLLRKIGSVAEEVEDGVEWRRRRCWRAWRVRVGDRVDGLTAGAFHHLGTRGHSENRVAQVAAEARDFGVALRSG